MEKVAKSERAKKVHAAWQRIFLCIKIVIFTA